MPRDVVVGLGSNLGDRLGHLRRAMTEIATCWPLRARSAVYESAPVGPPQPDYLNAAVLFDADADLAGVLCRLQDIEARGGRVRLPGQRWGARTIDLDILWAGQIVVATPSLVVPHPRLTERPFALLPLLDVVADAVDPRTGSAFARPAPCDGVRRTDLRL